MMPYEITENDKGRFVVTSPKGKTWKTTYPTMVAAEKGVAYVESRFGGGSQAASRSSSSSSSEDPDTTAERKALGLPTKMDQFEAESKEDGW